MTRKEEIRKASIEYTMRNAPICIGGDAFSEKIDELNRNHAFEEGAKWADNHPKLTWISVKDDLPYKHQELIANNIHPFLTIKVLIKTKVRVHTAFMIKDIINDKWIWYDYGKDENQITHWMSIPKLPKDE